MRYGRAEAQKAWREDAQLEAGLEVSVTKLHEMERYGEVAQYMLHATDGLVTQGLTIEVISGRVVAVHSTIAPGEDVNLRFWASVVGERLYDLYPLLVGNFADEVELDGVLDPIRTELAGSPAEPLVSPVLGEMRTRAGGGRASGVAYSPYGGMRSRTTLVGASPASTWPARPTW